MTRRCPAGWALAFVMLAGCSEVPTTPSLEPPPTGPGVPPIRPDAPPVAHIRATTPTALYAARGETVKAPAVVVTDTAGAPLPGVSVQFAVVAGGGSLGSRTAVTDASGRATASMWVLGRDAGENVVIAWAGDLLGIAFTAIGRTDGIAAAYGLISGDVLAQRDMLGARYILYDDGTFSAATVRNVGCFILDACIELSTQRGIYEREDSSLVFTYDSGRDLESGVVRGDSLYFAADDPGGARTYVAATAPLEPLVYERSEPHTWQAGAHSRYVLHEADSTFGLQYETATFGSFTYTGRYKRMDTVITFVFDDWSAAGPWIAHGTTSGDTMVVSYNDVMQMDDFEDGVYILSRPTATGAGGSHVMYARDRQ